MLFKQEQLDKIKMGEISLAFRKWKKPSVREGSLLKTSVGVLRIEKVQEIQVESITEEEARQAGYGDMKALRTFLQKNSEGNIYKIKLTYHSEDPRVQLREEVDLSDRDFNVLKQAIDRLDAYSKSGPWTLEILEVIRDNPKRRAIELAQKTGREKEWLKLNIRKLKNLGLTISHTEGYTISPRGLSFLQKLPK